MRILINGTDLFGNVLELHYNGADDSIYIRGTDSSGIARERRYFSGDYKTVVLNPPDADPAPQTKTPPPSTGPTTP